MIDYFLLGWMIAILVGCVAGVAAYQKASRNKTLWGMLMVLSAFLLGLIGVAISIVLFFLFADTQPEHTTYQHNTQEELKYKE